MTTTQVRYTVAPVEVVEGGFRVSIRRQGRRLNHWGSPWRVRDQYPKNERQLRRSLRRAGQFCARENALHASRETVLTELRRG